MGVDYGFAMEVEVMRDLMLAVAKRCPGGKLPENYIILDSETTGTDIKQAAVLQWGFCVVEQRKPRANFSTYVKRPSSLQIDPMALKLHGIDHAVLEKHGEDPYEVMSAVIENLEAWRRRGFMFSGHNLMRFDAELLEREAKELGLHFRFGDNEVIDTGMLVKASQLGLPFKDKDSLRSYYERVSNVRATVKWSLDRHCIKHYKLARFVNQDVIDKAHDAAIDTLLTHHLFEVMRDTVFGGPCALREAHTNV